MRQTRLASWLRALAAMVLLLLLAIVLTLAVAPLVLGLLPALGIAGADPREVVFRILQIGTIAATALLLRALPRPDGGAGADAAWGLYAGPGALSRGLRGFVAGASALAVVAAVLLLLEVREIRYDLRLELAHWVLVVLRALLAATLIALLEEVWFRGGLYGLLQRHGGVAPAAVLGSMLYAASHFIDRGEPQDAVPAADPWHALQGAVGGVFQAGHLDSMLALLAAGLWLAALRRRQSDIIGAIGLHMGFVFVIKVFKKMTYINPDAPLRAVAGHYDDMIGWLALVVLGGCAAWSWRRSVTARR
jgi:membrane protease YdiL (CAAX protease family)